jgi:hypothetical protein
VPEGHITYVPALVDVMPQPSGHTAARNRIDHAYSSATHVGRLLIHNECSSFTPRTHMTHVTANAQ